MHKQALVLSAFALFVVILVSGCTQEAPPMNETSGRQAKLSVEPEFIAGNGTVTVRITPTRDNVLSGHVSIFLEDVPENARIAYVAFYRPSTGNMLDALNHPDTMLEELQPFNNWETFIDTTKMEDGIYKLGVAMADERLMEEGPWIGWLETEVVISNSG